MRKNIILIILFSITLGINAQQRHNGAVYQEVNNKEVVLSVFPKAEQIEKENTFWFRILDGNKKLLGYAMSSVPYCKDIIGYNDNTPVLMVTDTRLKILKVALLSHWETLSYLNKLESKGFFNYWNNKNIKQVQSLEIDGYTGATLTAKAVEKNVRFLADNGLKNLPKKQ